MKEFKVTLQSYSQSTSFNIPLSTDDLDLLKDIEKATNNKIVSLTVEENK